MFTDMVGFSRKMGADELQALELLLIHDRILSETITAHQGRVLKKMGDAFFAEFGSAVSAVQCAVAIQTALKDHNTVTKPDEQIVIRIGIHLGDVVVQGDDLYGEGVNVAARLEPLAEPGGICLSDMVFKSVRNQSSFGAIHVGEVDLKNILEKYVVYRIAPLYTVEKKGEAQAAQSAASGELRFKVKSVKQQATVGRSRWLYVVKWTLINRLFLIFTMLLMHALLEWDKSESEGEGIQRIQNYEVIDEDAFLLKVCKSADPVSSYLRSRYSLETRRLFESYDPEESNHTLVLAKILLSLPHTDGWNELWYIPEYYSSNPKLSDRYDSLIHSPPNLDAIVEHNLAILYDYYPELRQRSIYEFVIFDMIPSNFKGTGLLKVLATALFLFLVSSPVTLRVAFSDLRGADQGLMFLTSEMRFKRRRQDSRGIRFRRWRFLGSIFQNLGGIRVRVDGNTILITSSNIVIQRAKRLFKQHLET